MKVLNVLLIEESIENVKLIKSELEQDEFIVNFDCVSTPSDFSSALTNKIWDIVICNISILNFSANAALKIINKMNIEIPFVVILNSNKLEQIGLTCIKEGANDYVIIDHLVRLTPIIQRELRKTQNRLREIMTSKQLKDQYLSMVSHKLHKPLNEIQGSIDILKSNEGDKKKLEETLDKMYMNSKLLAKLIKELLETT